MNTYKSVMKKYRKNEQENAIYSRILSDLPQYFTAYPKDKKGPPISLRPIINFSWDDKDQLHWDFVGWTIQIALAGFNEFQVNVIRIDRTIVVEFDNTSHPLISDEFKHNLKYEFVIGYTLDPACVDAIMVNGLLIIDIPCSKEDTVYENIKINSKASKIALIKNL